MRLSTRLSIAMIALVLLTAGAVGVLVYRNVAAAAMPRILDRLDTDARLIAIQLEGAAGAAPSDVRTQGRGLDAVVSAVLAGDAASRDRAAASSRERLASRFVAELNAKPTYAQYRLIRHNDGWQEVMRVDRRGPGGAVRVVPASGLRHEKQDDFFESVTRLQPGEYQVSSVELSKENGAVEIPHVPTARVASPVYASDGSVFGLLVIDLDLRDAFMAAQAETAQNSHVYVVNENGDYLVHPDAGRAFGFDLGRRHRLQDDMPELAALLASERTTPRIAESRDGERFGVGWEALRLAGGPKAFAIVAVPYAELLSATSAIRNSIIFAGLVAALGAIGLAILLARQLSLPLIQMARSIEDYVRTGSMSVPVSTGGEIGALADAFSRMAVKVESNTAALMREIEERRGIFDASIDLILVTDKRGKFVQVSRSAYDIIGYTPDEMVGRSAVEFVFSEDLDSTRNEMRLARRGQQIRNFETRYVRKDGRVVPLSWTGVWSEPSQKYYFIGRDRTEQILADEKFAESQNMARDIVATALDAIVQIDEDGVVIEWNPQAERTFGWTREEAIGRRLTELYLPEGYRPRYLAMNEKLHKTGVSLSDRFEFEATRRDGRTIKTEVSMIGVPRRSGNIFNLFIRDLTEKIAAEDQLRQAQKMEAVGQLTGGIAHDFNNMLTVITGTVDILSEALAGNPRLAALAKLIGEAADRGAELTSQLLAFARKQPLQPRTTDINDLIERTGKLMQPMLGEQIEIEYVLEKAAWTAVIDPTQLTTALLNLALNARDAMNGHGKLTIESKNVVIDDEESAKATDVAPGKYLLLSVSDTGSGIPRELRDKIFEPFFSTKEVGKGTGLGLSMVYGFVKQSGGQIKVYSEEGEGTTFNIYLPSGTVQTAASEMTGDLPAQGGTETIMVVEDDPAVRAYVIEQLRTLGYEVIDAANANEALKVVDAGTRFDLLFTDLMMPGKMNGQQLAEEVQRRRPDAKVLFTSGYTQNALIHRGRLDPHILLLAKPYRRAELARMVRRALTETVNWTSDQEVAALGAGS